MGISGTPYPIQPHARGYLHVQEGTQLIKSDLLAILLSSNRERVMLPGFGAGLRDFMFEPADSITIQAVTERLAQQISAWEPRVVIENIQVGFADSGDLDPSDTLVEQESILYIRISFLDPENIKEIDELVLEVPMA